MERKGELRSGKRGGYQQRVKGTLKGAFELAGEITKNVGK